MNSNQNLIPCNKCNRVFIYEEYDFHNCQNIKLTIFDTDGNRWCSYDGISFFELPSFSPNFKHPNGTPDESTEPKNLQIFSK